MLTVSRGGHDGAPQSRPNPLLDPTRLPDGYVPILCTEHGRFVAWCSPPAPTCRVACSAACDSTHTSPIPPIPAGLVEGVPGSTVAQPSRRDAIGAVEAGASEQEHEPGRGDGEPAADDATGPTEHPCECDLPDRPGSCPLCQARAAAAVDPDDTSRCPTWPGCDTCGAVDDLAVAVAETSVGIGCLTLCGSCADAGDLPRWSVLAAYARVAGHAGHLGTDVDTLAAASRRSPGSGGVS